MTHCPLYRSLRPLVVAGGLLLLVAATGATAFAHANLRTADPPADQAVAIAPDRVRLSFTESLDQTGSGLMVLDVSGARVDLGDTVFASGEPSASVGLGPLGSGVYTVAWTSRSLDDGDDAKGYFSFAVGAPTAPPVASIQGPNGGDPGSVAADDLTIGLTAPPTAGARALEVSVASGGQPLVDAQRVQIRLTAAALDLGVATVSAELQDDSRYVATTWLPSLPGTWQAEVRVRREGHDDATATFTLQL